MDTNENREIPDGMKTKSVKLTHKQDRGLKEYVKEKKKTEPAYSEGMAIRKWVREGLEKVRRMLSGEKD